MRHFSYYTILVILCASLPIEAQVALFPYSESFDYIVAPALPTDWSVNGFILNSSTARSSPNCISTTGNATTKYITSPAFNFTDHIPDKLIFWERRSGTAAAYRFEVRASLDGTDFNILLAHYDTIPSTSGYIQRSMNLRGSGLQQQSNVRLRWQLLGDSTNNTGVLRIDDVSLTTATGFDLGLTRMAFSPANATRKDTVTVSVCVKNCGSFAVSGFAVQFFFDSNLNGIAESHEPFDVIDGLSLSPGDSMICEIRHPPLQGGEHRFIAALGFNQDENRSNDTMHAIVNIHCVKGDLLISEIMYAPAGDEPEWVEFYNTTPDSINLKNWRISDSNGSIKSLLTQSDKIIPPYSYCVAAKDSNFSSIHPNVFSVITNFSALNNTTADAVVLYDTFFQSIDSVLYQPTWGGQNGKSLERIDFLVSSTVAANWQSSQDSLGCTPGMINSIARLDYDLSISSLTQSRILSNGKIVPVLNVTIQNIGRQAIDTVILYFFANRNRSQYPNASELLESIVSTQRIFAGDSLQISESLPQLAAGEMSVVITLENWSDERLSNNQALVVVKMCYEPRSLIINEIMYDPLNNQNEWFEVYNRSSQSIDLAQWTFNDRATSSGMNSFFISNKSSIVRPGEFVVLAADSSLFTLFQNILQADSTLHVFILNHSSGLSLNNDGDAVILKDLTGETIDSVAYLPGWHHPDVVDTHGRSLERINPNGESNDQRNWSTCTNISGGTPGKINSIMTRSVMSNSVITLSPNPFSPDGDGFEDFCMIHYNLSMMTSTISLRIYDIKGRLIRTLANGELAGSQGEILWNGFDDNKQRARVGIYIIYFEANDRSSGRTECSKAVAVVATKL
jgi:hypothetical protein